MNAGRKMKIARLLVALGGVGAFGASALAQPRNTLQYHGDPVYAEPIRYEHERPVGTIWVDGEAFDLSECEGVRAGIIEALSCAGYDVWCDGYTIVVDTSCHTPCIEWESCKYRLTVRERCDEMRLWVRPRHRHGEVIEVPVEPRRDRYRIEEPVLIEPEPTIYRGGRYDDRRERPGNREDDRSYRGEPRGRGPVFRGPPSYETEHFGIGFEIDEDDDIRFDINAGFFRTSPGCGW